MSIAEMLRKKMQLESFNFRYEIERISAELSFAEKLTVLHPEHSSEWQPLIDSAATAIDGLPHICDATALEAAVRKTENLLAPLAKTAKSYTVHCVGHAHIDMNWMWSWPETVAVTIDTFNTVLKLLEEYPDFIFSQSQASVYAIVEKFAPEMLEEIRRHVRNKRWEVTASHWVENDRNMACGEALTRHLLYTRRYMKKLFDLEPEDVNIDWAPDTFGHAASIPTYLTRGGIKYTYLHRPGNMTDPKPGAFWWEGPDGSRLLVRNDMKHGYNGRIGSDIADKMVDFVRENGGRDYMFVYGIGDHGGGPTRCDLNRIVDMHSWPIFPQIKFSSARAFFDTLAAGGDNLPVLSGELNFEFTGCYTTQTQIKKANRYGENLLADAEFAATMNWRLNQCKYPAGQFEQLWRNCLFQHFHDILPGSGVRGTRHYTLGQFQELTAEAGTIETSALRRIAGMISTSTENGKTTSPLHTFFHNDGFGAGVGIGTDRFKPSFAGQTGQGDRPFVIFNPTEHERREVVEIMVWDNPIIGDETPLKDRKFAFRTAEGTLRNTQFINSGHEWGHNYVRLALPVTVPGFGYTVCTITEEEPQQSAETSLKPIQPPHHCSYAYNERTSRFGGENEFVLLEINPTTGGILRLKDKTSGRDIISPDNQVPILEFTVERARPMSAWCIEHSAAPEPMHIRSITQEYTGPYLIRIKVEAEIRRSSFTVCYDITAGNPMVGIIIKGTWLESGNKIDGTPALRIPFALNLDRVETSYEIPFGEVKRDCRHDEEVPALQWVKAGNPEQLIGVLLVNDCKYGFALDGSTLRASLIRSSYEPDPNPELGEHEVRLGLLPYSGELTTAQATQAGRAFNHQLRIIGTGLHGGTLPPTGSLIRILSGKVIISGLKKAEDRDALVIRLYETAGKEQEIKISFDRNLGELITAELVDLQERPAAEEWSPEVTTDGVTFKVSPYSLVSLRLTFK